MTKNFYYSILPSTVSANGTGPGLQGSGSSISTLSSSGFILALETEDGGGNPTCQIYSYHTNAWNQLGNDITGAVSSLSLSSNGTTAAIGFGTIDTVRINDFDGTLWNQLRSDIGGEAAYDYFGSSASLSSDGTMLAIGAYLNDGNEVVGRSGHVQV